jgi:hypothetical protein
MVTNCRTRRFAAPCDIWFNAGRLCPKEAAVRLIPLAYPHTLKGGEALNLVADLSGRLTLRAQKARRKDRFASRLIALQPRRAAPPLATVGALRANPHAQRRFAAVSRASAQAQV